MLQKKVSPKGQSVKVTFELPADVAENSIAVVGDFNDWDQKKAIMKLDEKQGVWKKTVSLKPGNTYEFRYFIDERTWRNEEEADRFAANPYFSENSVLDV